MAKEEYIKRIFAEVAPVYDRFNLLASWGNVLLWQRRFVRLCRIEPGIRVLDVCCGTGKVSALLAHRAGAGGCVIGLDFSDDMLRRATAARGLSYTRGDALDLPFHDDSFDLVTSTFALRNLSCMSSFMKEAHRVLVPGGRLCVMDMYLPAMTWLRTAYRLYLRHALPLIGRIVNPGAACRPYHYLAVSITGFADPYCVSAVMSSSGFARVRMHRVSAFRVYMHEGTKAERIS
ncbi:MAG: ubiquinone/menaquinone biosynthesis methyltransferase [Bacillota bacterium]